MSEVKEYDLLPCPFCGREPRVIEETPNAYPDFQVFCICEAEPVFSVPKKDRELAIRAWNTRKDKVREAAEKYVEEGTHADVDRWGVCTNEETCAFCLLNKALGR